MDSNKLKALKVVDLRAILAKGNVSAPAKATKSDLITRIQASKPAQDAYLSLYPPQDDLLAPPEDVDWNVEQPVIVPPPASEEPKELVIKPPAPPPTVTPIDPELEKRQKRAERFGIPLIEPKNSSTPDVRPDKKNLKRPAAQADVVDPEEVERRRKRADRFGTAKKT